MTETTNVVLDNPATDNLDFAEELRKQTAGVRLRLERFGLRRSLRDEQLETAASAFGAQRKVISASKKLLDTNHKSYKAVTSLLAKARRHWVDWTVPFVEDGIRLIRKDRLDEFDAVLASLSAQLSAAVAELNAAYPSMKMRAAADQGKLFDVKDYPSTLDGEFSIVWEYPSVEPPDHLKTLHPALWARECERVKAKFAEAIGIAEQTFAEKLHSLLAHLMERLEPDPVTGERKVFRDSAVKNLHEFFDRFASLNIGSNKDLDKLVSDTKAVIGGMKPDTLRTDTLLQGSLKDQLAPLTAAVDSMIVKGSSRKFKALPVEAMLTESAEEHPEPNPPDDPALETEAPAAEAAGMVLPLTKAGNLGSILGAGVPVEKFEAWAEKTGRKVS